MNYKNNKRLKIMKVKILLSLSILNFWQYQQKRDSLNKFKNYLKDLWFDDDDFRFSINKESHKKKTIKNAFNENSIYEFFFSIMNYKYI